MPGCRGQRPKSHVSIPSFPEGITLLHSLPCGMWRDQEGGQCGYGLEGNGEASGEHTMEAPIRCTQKVGFAFELLPPLKMTH